MPVRNIEGPIADECGIKRRFVDAFVVSRGLQGSDRMRRSMLLGDGEAVMKAHGAICARGGRFFRIGIRCGTRKGPVDRADRGMRRCYRAHVSAPRYTSVCISRIVAMATFSVLRKVYAAYRIDAFTCGVAIGRGSEHVFSLLTLTLSDSVTAG